LANLDIILKDPRKLMRWGLYGIAALLLLLWLGPLVAGTTPNRIIQSTITGVLIGGVYALIALGIVVINKASGVFNFAHGGMMMVGGFMFLTFFVQAAVNPWIAVALGVVTAVLVFSTGRWRDLLNPVTAVSAVVTAAVIAALLILPSNAFDTIPLLSAVSEKWVRGLAGAAVGAALLGLAVERFTIRPLIGQPLFASVMVTLAVSQVLNGITQLIWGSVPQTLLIFSELNPVGIESRVSPLRFALFDINISIQRTSLYAFGLALVAFLAFWAFFRFTSVGLAMRASSENQTLAQSLGLRVRAILAVAWGIAALLGVVAGVLQGGANQVDTNLQFLALRALPAVLLGGIESIPGALIGGLAIGLSEQWASLLFSTDVGEQLAPYVVLMVILILRPEGLFGQKRIDRI
jgi:branched-chain amino acid transport system permease protein